VRVVTASVRETEFNKCDQRYCYVQQTI